MAFDERLAERVRDALDARPGLTERRMFGGIAFMLSGHMACGVLGDELLVRLAPADADAALAREGVRRFDLTGRPMRGWVLVGGDVVADDGELAFWVDEGAAHAASMPPKGRV